jgi:hypothetical protein
MTYGSCHKRENGNRECFNGYHGVLFDMVWCEIRSCQHHPTSVKDTHQPTIKRLSNSGIHHQCSCHDARETIAGLTTVLRFKATIMNRTHAEINGLMDKLLNEAKRAKDGGDMKALLTSTKR